MTRRETIEARLRRGGALGVLVALGLIGFGSVAGYAAKNPNKVDKGARSEKIERKLERANATESAALQHQLMAAVPPAPSPSRTDRGSDRRSDRSRGEYREPTSPADARFDSFRIILERNIFNPTRIGRVRPGSEVKPPRLDSIALVGTMRSDQGVVAFFDSPDAAFRKVLHVGQSVGEFKVQRIQPDEVELARDGKPLTLKVQQQLRRPEGGDWTIAAVERPAPDSTGTAAATAGQPPEPAAPPPIPPDASEALRRLMEQRQKQLKQ